MSKENKSNIVSVEIPSKRIDDGPESDGVYLGKVKDIPDFAGELWYRLFSEEEVRELNSDEKLKCQKNFNSEMPIP